MLQYVSRYVCIREWRAASGECAGDCAFEWMLLSAVVVAVSFNSITVELLAFVAIVVYVKIIKRVK